MVTWERSGTVFRYHRSTGEMDSLELDQPTRVYPGVHCSTLVVPTGSVRYRIDVNDWTVLDERSTATPYASPLFDGNRLYVTGSGGLQAVGADEGLLWTYSNDRLVTGIASTDEAVYAVESNADGGRLTVLDAETGDVHWRTDRIGETYADPVVGRNVYVTNAAGHVLALDRENGEVRWTHRTGTLDSRFTVPAVGDDAVFVADEDTGSVRAVGRTDGETRWETPIYRDADGRRRAGTLFAPVLTEQGVLVSAGSAGIIGLLREDGQRFYRDASRTLVSPLGAARKTIYGATPSGLFVLKLSG